MAQVKLCLFISLAISCLVQSIMSVPMVVDGVLVEDTNVPVLMTNDVYDMKEKKDLDDPSILLNRFRRYTAQWNTGSHHYNDYNHDVASRRFAHRRPSARHQGGGQIVDA